MSKFFKASVLFILGCAGVMSLHQIEAKTCRTMQYEDIVNIEKPKHVTISPDGLRIVFVVQKANIEENRNIDSLYLANTQGSSREKLGEWDEIKKIVWGDNDTFYILGQEKEEHKILVSRGSKPISLICTSKPISTFTPSADGSHLYYTQSTYTPEPVIKALKEEGYVYRWLSDSAGRAIECKEWEEIWRLNISSDELDEITRFSYENWLDYMNLISDLQLSEDGRYLSIIVARFGRPELGEHAFTSDLWVWDVKNKTTTKLLHDRPTTKQTPRWVSDEELVFQENNCSERAIKLWLWNTVANSYAQLDFFHPEESIDSLIWNKEKKVLIAECDQMLFRLSLETWQVDKIQPPTALFRSGYLPNSFSFDQNVNFLASIAEDSNTPPQVIVYDVEKDKTTPLSSLNPALANLSRGHVEKMTVETKDGMSTVGYLVHPVNEEPGRRYPLIIATYGFYGQTFIADAEWHSSFPAQTLAAEGYFVLLLNSCGMAQNLIGDPEKARQIEGWNVLKTFERAVEMLDEKGLIDPGKVGVYGWSHGAFMVEFLISHSDKFHVACIGEGGDYNPSGFWVCGHSVMTKIYDNMFGGPPWGSTLQNYLDYSPFFQVDKIHSPLLMESAGMGVVGFEMYVPLRYLNVPAELVIYEGEEHNFVKPKARMASMARKLDWFNYWLMDKRDPNKPEQYARWDAMR